MSLPDARVRVPEAFLARIDTMQSIDALALWADADERLHLFAAAAGAGAIHALDPATGEVMRTITRGNAGTLREPTALAVHGDMLFVVERAAQRIQTFRLPQLAPISSIRDAELVAPRAIALVSHPTSADLYIVDDSEDGDSSTSRIHLLRVTFDTRGRPRAERMRVFDESTNGVALGFVSDVAIDAVLGRVLVTDTDAGVVHNFTLAGDATGEFIGADVLDGSPTGIDLYACGMTGRWIIATNGPSGVAYRLIDRSTLEYVGAFVGHVANHAGRIAVTSRQLPEHSSGVLYAIDDSTSVAGFSWQMAESALPAARGCPTGSGR